MSLWSLARVAGCCLLPIALLEAGMQHFGRVGPLGPTASTALTESHGLHYPARCLVRNFGRLESGGESVASLCTDAWGTIEPTSLEALLATPADNEGPYILACGGGTTEVAVVEPEDRWPAVLADRLGVSAVNAGAASKDLATCARTLDFLLRHAPRGRPPLILIASNVNTLGSFVAARSAPGWNRDSIPEQAYAPTPPHPQLRAWIPGLYHLAATLAAGIGQGDAGRYARELEAGCCHVSAAANREPGRRFDWDDAANRDHYANFVGAMLGRVEAVLERHGIEHDRVLFIEEPNAYGFAAMPHLARDFRQRLHGLDGKPLDLETSATLTARYDEVYMDAVATRGFDVVRAASFRLPPAAFYDAVHLTTAGSLLYGEHLARVARRELGLATMP